MPIWNKLFTKATSFTPSGTLVSDKNGNIYTFTEGFDSVNHQFTGFKPIGITKFSPSGNILWHIYYSAKTDIFPLQIDENNNLYFGYSTVDLSNQITLGNTTITVNPPNFISPFVSFGSLSPDGNVRWLRGFLTSNTNQGGSFKVTSVSISGNQLFFCGYSGQFNFLLDFGSLINGRCSAWFAALNCNTGQAVWGKTHPLFLYCLGSVCFCRTPYINANPSSGRVSLVNNLNGAFVFQPGDTIASITNFGQPDIKPYYTIYDTNGIPVKGKIIELSTTGYSGAQHIAGSRNKF